MSKKQSKAGALNTTQVNFDMLMTHLNKDSFEVASSQVDHLFDCIEQQIKYKTIDLLKRPYSINSSISIVLRSFILEIYRPDRKDDDIIFIEEQDFEPTAPPLDTFAQNNKVTNLQVTKKELDQEERESKTPDQIKRDIKGRINKSISSLADSQARDRKANKSANMGRVNLGPDKMNFKHLDIKDFQHNDGLNENILDFLRQRLLTKEQKKVPDKSKKKKYQGASAFTSQENEILKKDHTYDHEGNLLEVKHVKTDYLPNLTNQNPKIALVQGQQIAPNEQIKKLKQKQVHVNPPIEAMKREFSQEIMKVFSKENNQKIEVSKENMNLKDQVKPTFGVDIIDGEDINKGPDYTEKKKDGKISMKEYREKYENLDVIHRIQKQSNHHMKVPTRLSFNDQTAITTPIITNQVTLDLDQTVQQMQTRKRINTTSKYNQRIQVTSQKARQEYLLERADSHRHNFSFSNAQSITPSVNSTIQGKMTLHSTKNQDSQNEKQIFFGQRNTSQQNRDKLSNIIDKIVTRQDDLDKRQIAIQSQLSSRKPNKKIIEGETMFQRQRLLQEDQSMLSFINQNANSLSFVDRNIIQSQLGTRSKLANIAIKQKFNKNELRKEILPPPPLGKSIGHGIFKEPYQLRQERSIDSSQYQITQ